MKQLARSLMLPVIGIPLVVTLLSGKTPTPPSPRPSLTPVDCNLSLIFQHDPENRFCPVPNTSADPRLVNGTSSPATNNTYYCKITVQPMQGGNYDPNTYKTHWTQRGESMKIKVPKELPSTLIIDFYEDCNACKSGTQGRPVFRSRTQLNPGQTHVLANLSYSMKVPC